MINVDSNVLSALMQQKPKPTVVEWLDAQPAETVWITSITLMPWAISRISHQIIFKPR